MIVAADGAEAVALFAPRSHEISILITDLSMPNPDGTSVATVALRMSAKFMIPSMSGLSSGGQDNEVRRVAGSIRVKPFKAEILLIRVNNLLQGRPSDAAPTV